MRKLDKSPTTFFLRLCWVWQLNELNKSCVKLNITGRWCLIFYRKGNKNKNAGMVLRMNHKIFGYVDNIAVFGSNQKDIERVTKTFIREVGPISLQEN